MYLANTSGKHELDKQLELQLEVFITCRPNPFWNQRQFYRLGLLRALRPCRGRFSRL